MEYESLSVADRQNTVRMHIQRLESEHFNLEVQCLAPQVGQDVAPMRERQNQIEASLKNLHKISADLAKAEKKA